MQNKKQVKRHAISTIPHNYNTCFEEVKPNKIVWILQTYAALDLLVRCGLPLNLASRLTIAKSKFIIDVHDSVIISHVMKTSTNQDQGTRPQRKKWKTKNASPFCVTNRDYAAEHNIISAFNAWSSYSFLFQQTLPNRRRLIIFKKQKSKEMTRIWNKCKCLNAGSQLFAAYKDRVEYRWWCMRPWLLNKCTCWCEREKRLSHSKQC